MANLWVIITGLNVFVEPVRQDEPGTVLLLRVGEGTQVEGREISSHEPLLQMSGASENIIILDRDVEFLPSPGGVPEIRKRNLLVPLGNAIEQPPLKVRKELVGPRNAIGPDSPRIARVRLAGGVVRPIHIDENFNLRAITTNVNILLKEVIRLDRVTSRPVPKDNRPISNGLLYSLHVADNEGPVSVSIDGQKSFPKPIDASATGNLPLENHDANYVVWIVNVGKAHPPTEDEDFDRDFHLLYDFLEKTDEPRFIPVTILQRGEDTGDGFPPGQCVHGYALSGQGVTEVHLHGIDIDRTVGPVRA